MRELKMKVDAVSYIPKKGLTRRWKFSNRSESSLFFQSSTVAMYLARRRPSALVYFSPGIPIFNSSSAESSSRSPVVPQVPDSG